MVEPEVVATSPYPIKSRVPVCCGLSSTRMVGERGLLTEWSLLPVLPRLDLLTKKACGLPRGG
jgi:hypothetical protein